MTFICIRPFKMFSAVALALFVTLSVRADSEDERIAEAIPFPRQIFTQGLEIVEDQLWVSSGGYGTSFLARYSFPDLELQKIERLPAQLFAEGLTVIGPEVWLLTWRARRLLRYDRVSLRYLGGAAIPSEGWGLTHSPDAVWMSDGTHQLRFAEKKLPLEWKILTVTENGRPLTRLNELEWVEGEIWANVWQTNRLVRIHPASGLVLGDITLDNLLPASERRPDTDVLNGIARDPASGAIWVTGKRWPWLYRLSDTILASE